MTTAPKRLSLDQVPDIRATHRVVVRNLVLPARIGVYRHEQSAPQRVRINLELTVEDSGQPLNDEIRNVVSYEDVVNGVKAILEQGHINLVETLAEKVVEFCLADLRVAGVRVGIEKLHAIPEAESAGVEIERFRTNR